MELKFKQRLLSHVVLFLSSMGGTKSFQLLSSSDDSILSKGMILCVVSVGVWMLFLLLLSRPTWYVCHILLFGLFSLEVSN